MIPDHLNQAREIAEYAQNITHALIAIAEALNAAGTPRTAPRSDAEHAQAPDSGPKPARPPEPRTYFAESDWGQELPVGALDARHLGKRVYVGGWSGTLVEIHHDQDGTSLQWDDDGLPGGCHRDPDALVEVQW